MLQVWAGRWRSPQDRHPLQRQGVLWTGGRAASCPACAAWSKSLPLKTSRKKQGLALCILEAVP